MRGTIRKKGNMYYIRYYIDGKQVEKKGGSTQEDAERALTNVMYRIQNGYVNPSEMTIKEYLSMWLEDYIKDDRSKGTYSRYEQVCTLHINPCLGNIRLCDLKVINIEKYIKELKKKKVNNKPLSATTVQSCYGVLKSALNKAVKLQLINDNPCRFVDTPKRSKYKANVLTVEEFSKIYNSLDSKKYEDYIMQFAMSLTLETGLRRGEMCGLTWKDINFKEKYLEVNQALIRDKNKYIISDLKTESSYRKLPLSNDIINKLNFHKTKQKKNRVKYGETYTKINVFEKVEYDLIFTWENGKYIIPSNFLQRFKRLSKYNGIDKNIRWHDLRHTNATLLLEGGANIKTVQERLGHSLMQTTSDTYAHVTEKMNREATNIITDILKIK